MCYLIAKDRFSHGCIALKTTHGQHLADLKRMLNTAVGNTVDAMGPTGIELVTISRPEAYGEYAPYRFVESEEEFIALVKAMRS